jgi:hypothetical protein
MTEDPEVAAHLEKVTPAKRRRDAQTLLGLMRRVTGAEPELHGSIIGFGTYHYRYDSGREGDGPAASFAPRKAATVVYLMDGIGDARRGADPARTSRDRGGLSVTEPLR